MIINKLNKFDSKLILDHSNMKVRKLKSDIEPLSINMKSSIILLELFLVAILLALIVTVMNSVFDVQILAITLISPLIILNIIFIYFCRKRKALELCRSFNFRCNRSYTSSYCKHTTQS